MKEYLKFLHQLSEQKELDNDKLMERLVNAGLPVIPIKPKKLSLIKHNILEVTPVINEIITEIN